MDTLLELIREAGRQPIQRDSEYNVLQRFDAVA
jgi:2-iminoacetate synthase ThiH